MDEEKKETQAEPPKAEEQKEAPQSAPVIQQAPVAKESAVPIPKVEKPANCASCNKSIKNKRWYYRNGKFFCTKRCWKTMIKKEETKEEAQGEKK